MRNIDQFENNCSTYLQPIQDLFGLVADMCIEDFIRSDSHMEVGLGGIERYLSTSVRDDALPFIDLLCCSEK